MYGPLFKPVQYPLSFSSELLEEELMLVQFYALSRVSQLYAGVAQKRKRVDIELVNVLPDDGNDRDRLF